MQLTHPKEAQWQFNTDLNQSEIWPGHLCLAGAQELFASEHWVTNKAGQEMQVQHRIEFQGFNTQWLSQNSLLQIPPTHLCYAATSAEVISKQSHWVGTRCVKFKPDGFMIQVPN